MLGNMQIIKNKVILWIGVCFLLVLLIVTFVLFNNRENSYDDYINAGKHEDAVEELSNIILGGLEWLDEDVSSEELAILSKEFVDSLGLTGDVTVCIEDVNDNIYTMQEYTLMNYFYIDVEEMEIVDINTLE